MPDAAAGKTDRQYDRQIRLWGRDAQQRMGNAKVLIVGLRGLAAEVAKNIVLAGIGQVSIMDSTMTTEEDLGANYFLSEAEVGNKTRAEGARERLNALNPLCSVVVEGGTAEDLTEEMLKKFNVVCVTGERAAQIRRINAICHSNNIGFFSADSHGLFASVFVDLQKHPYTVEKKSQADAKEQRTEVSEKEAVYPSLAEADSSDWTRIQLPTKKISPIFFAMQAVQKAHDALGKYPGDGDAEALTAARKALCGAHNVEDSMFDSDLIGMIAAQGDADLNAVCSMVGGLVADNILKAISRKEEPLVNHFVFDGRTGAGMVYTFPAQGKCAGDKKRPRDDEEETVL